MIKVYPITENEASSLKDFIRYNFIKSIRDDEEIDSLLYLKNILTVYERLGGLKEDYDDYESSEKVDRYFEELDSYYELNHK